MTIKEIINTKNNKISIDKIIKKFYENFKKEYNTFLGFIQGIPVKFDHEWYGFLILNRLMLILIENCFVEFSSRNQLNSLYK